MSYLDPLRFPTHRFKGVATAPEIAGFIGVDVAVILKSPRVDGRQEQVAVKVEPDPVAILFLQPGIIIFLERKVTLEELETTAVIVTADRKVAALLKVKEVKVDVSNTSVTVIVIATSVAFPPVSVILTFRL